MWLFLTAINLFEKPFFDILIQNHNVTSEQLKFPQ